MKISISDLELYVKCPKAYELHCINKIEPRQKSLSLCKAIAVRNVLQKVHEENKNAGELTDEVIGKRCEEVWKTEISDPKVDQKELEEIVVQAKPATKNKEATEAVTKSQKTLNEIKTWCTRYMKLENHSQVLFNDVRFETEIGDTVFCGKIDQVRQVQNEIEVLIFNTSSQAPSQNFLARDFQTSISAYAVWQGKLYPENEDCSEEVQVNLIPKVYCFYFPYLEEYKRNGKGQKGDWKGDPKIPVPRTEQMLLDFEYEVLTAAAGIELQYFPMRVTNPCGCAICPFAYCCKNDVIEMEQMEEYIECFQQ